MEERVLFCDCSGMPTPEEERNFPPIPPEKERELDEELDKIFDEICRQYGLEDEPDPPFDCVDVGKYILEQGGEMSTWKLQKLCYYSQAWHYTWAERRLITEDFQAWRNGPVCPELYELHKDKFIVSADDLPGDSSKLSTDGKESINVVLEDYGSRSPYELREQTHSEDPWLKARKNLPPDVHSEEIISLESMGEYYGSL